MPSIAELESIRSEAERRLDHELWVLNQLHEHPDVPGTVSQAWLDQKAVLEKAQFAWDEANKNYLTALAVTRELSPSE